MAITPVPPLSDVPDFPALSDRAAGTYNSKAYAFGTHMANTFNAELAAVANNVRNNATEAATAGALAAEQAAQATINGAAQVALAAEQAAQATINGAVQVALATTQAELAVTIANYKGVWSALSGALNMPATVSHNGNFWALNSNLADVTAWVPGVSAVWTPVIAGSIPQLSKSAAYTLTLNDGGKHILHPSEDTTARIFTIPANSAVPFPPGTAVTFVNQATSGTLTIAITSDVMRLATVGTTGSRTLGANGIATALKIRPTEWIISGSNLT